jgi:hypothetical protein
LGIEPTTFWLVWHFVCVCYGIKIRIYSTILCIASLVTKPWGLLDGYGCFEETCRFLGLNPLRPLLCTLGLTHAFTLKIDRAVTHLCNLKCSGAATFILFVGSGGRVIYCPVSRLAVYRRCVSPDSIRAPPGYDSTMIRSLQPDRYS